MARLPHGTPVFRTDEIRRIETAAAAQGGAPLMELAGLAAAELARELCHNGKRVVVVAGPGNNGGDALVLARHLKSSWFNVSVLFAGDANKLPADAKAAHAAWLAAGGTLAAEVPRMHDCGLVVDGLFGIGLQRDVTGRYADLVSAMNNVHCPVLALDVPTGIESDTGRVLGCAVEASHTVTFIGYKSGLLTLDGPDHCGTLELATLDIDARAFGTPSGHAIGADALALALRPRKLNTHKGDYGSVGIVGGASGMVGAALLAGRAALKTGAGRVYVGLLGTDAPAVDVVQPELMLKRAEDVLHLKHLACIAAGPGLGESREAHALLAAALESSLPLVLDADALNLIARESGLRDAVAGRQPSTLLTPHPAEAARLLAISTADVQRDRVAAATDLAQRFRCGVVLKGAGSVCAWPDRTWAINTSGNPGMASAGMGDALTGILAALLAQGAEPRAALQCGVYLHGAAADTAVAAGLGPTGLTASEVIDRARDLVNAPTRERS
jgi:hydroxyethylthiazole kinase-like uncharacterized protein yjeF